MSSGECKQIQKEATVVGPMHWMRIEEGDIIELRMLGGRCMANVAYAEPYPAAVGSRTPSHTHHKNKNLHGVSAGHSLKRLFCLLLVRLNQNQRRVIALHKCPVTANNLLKTIS
jgi:hypothetical protein